MAPEEMETFYTGLPQSLTCPWNRQEPPGTKYTGVKRTLKGSFSGKEEDGEIQWKAKNVNKKERKSLDFGI
jgi:hypothetical protein